VGLPLPCRSALAGNIKIQFIVQNDRVLFPSWEELSSLAHPLFYLRHLTPGQLVLNLVYLSGFDARALPLFPRPPGLLCSQARHQNRGAPIPRFRTQQGNSYPDNELTYFLTYDIPQDASSQHPFQKQKPNRISSKRAVVKPILNFRFAGVISV
jgi:replication fork clamp-binding protein CrfC